MLLSFSLISSLYARECLPTPLPKLQDGVVEITYEQDDSFAVSIETSNSVGGLQTIPLGSITKERLANGDGLRYNWHHDDAVVASAVWHFEKQDEVTQSEEILQTKPLFNKFGAYTLPNGTRRIQAEVTHLVDFFSISIRDCKEKDIGFISDLANTNLKQTRRFYPNRRTFYPNRRTYESSIDIWWKTFHWMPWQTHGNTQIGSITHYEGSITHYDSTLRAANFVFVPPYQPTLLVRAFSLRKRAKPAKLVISFEENFSLSRSIAWTLFGAIMADRQVRSPQ